MGYACDEHGRPLAWIDKPEVPPGITRHNAWRRPKAGGRGPSLERLLRHLLDRMGGIEPDAERMIDLLDFLTQGARLRRDRAIRERLRQSEQGWRVVELKAPDLKRGGELADWIRSQADST